MARKTFRQLIKPAARIATRIRNKAYTKAYSKGKRTKAIKKFSLNYPDLTINKKSLLGQ
tara:strand:- start:128 stop:304 length:177 start_codon:yes stop_codon:yes gene_type:complete